MKTEIKKVCIYKNSKEAEQIEGIILNPHPNLTIKIKQNEPAMYPAFTVESLLEYIQNETVSLVVLEQILLQVPAYEKYIEGATIGSDKFIIKELEKLGIKFS